MKTLVIVLGLLLTASFPTYASEDGNGKKEIVLQVSDDDDLVDNPIWFGDEEPIAMSLLPSQSPYAYLYYNKVCVSFEGLTGISGVRVVDNVTGTWSMRRIVPVLRRLSSVWTNRGIIPCRSLRTAWCGKAGLSIE